MFNETNCGCTLGGKDIEFGAICAKQLHRLCKECAADEVEEGCFLCGAGIGKEWMTFEK